MRKFLFFTILSLFPIIPIFAQIDRFLIGVWSHSHDKAPSTYNAGIHTNIGNSAEFYNIFKEHNFNTIQVEHQLMPKYKNPVYSSSNPSKAFLDRADSMGLKVILNTPDLYVNRRDDTSYFQIPGFSQYNHANSLSGLEYYGNHPAVIGFSVCDEPKPVHFDDIGMYFNDIENYNPRLLRYVNLVPSHASDTVLGYPGMGNLNAYPLFVDNFINTTNPNILSFDYYPIYRFKACTKCNDVVWPNTFFQNLYLTMRVLVTQ